VQAWVPRIDPCDWPVLYLHAICASRLGVKRGIFQAAGFWFLDDDEGESVGSVGAALCEWASCSHMVLREFCQ
jgi:hypothetical protein